MKLDFELSGFDDDAEYDASDLNTTREKIEKHLSAGILFPEEIRNAERILRHLNKNTGSTGCLGSTTETIPA
ncbi:MAG: hypothetical protein PVI34_07670 [Desulfobacterales bacterium]|jgi:hypothetical protein